MMRGIRFLLALFAACLCPAAAVVDQGVAVFNQGRYSQALPLLQQAAQDKSNRTAQVYLGLTDAALNRCTDALPLLATQLDGPDNTLDRLAGLAALLAIAARQAGVDQATESASSYSTTIVTSVAVTRGWLASSR